jgi:hypothetical protein
VSYQTPVPTIPAVNQTTPVHTTPATVPTPTPAPAPGFLQLLREPWFVAVATAVVAVAVLLVLVLRGGGGVGGGRGTASVARALRTKADAYAVVLDLNTRLLYVVPMRRLSPYRYMFTKGRTNYLFVPVFNKPFVIEGTSSPCYLAVTGGPPLALELDPSLTLSVGLATSREGLSTAERVRDLVGRLVSELASGTTTYTSEIPSLPEVSVEVSVPKFLASLYMDTAAYTKSMLTLLTDAWTAIEEMARAMKAERFAGLPHLGRFLVYLGVFMMVAILALWLARYFGVF